jgi:hypothetical protein
MRIYIASSWKNSELAGIVAEYLRGVGHTVDCFCDQSSGRYVFHWTELVKTEAELQNYDAISFLHDARTKWAFSEDKKWLDWAEAVVLVLPAGRSAHLEAGYARGCGKNLFILGGFAKGEFDVMYGFADELYRIEENGLQRLACELQSIEIIRETIR